MATSFNLQSSQAGAMPPPPKRDPQQGNNKKSSQSSSKTTGTINSSQDTTSSGDVGGSSTPGEDGAEEDNSAETNVHAPDTKRVNAGRYPSSTATSQDGDDESASGALERKIAELQASGWRPEEEVGDTGEDDDYNDVDLLSDSDEGDSQLRKLEETLMSGDDGLDAEADDALARRLSLSSAGSDLAYLSFNDNHLFSETVFDQTLAHLDPDHLFLDIDPVVGDKTPLARQTSRESLTTQRRVRFQDEVDVSDGASSDTDQDQEDMDTDFFPDLFVQQDHLDPTFRALIEQDDHDVYMDNDSDTGSYWDFEADEMRMLAMDADEDDSDNSDSTAGSSGYESDDGDTTDEEPFPPPPLPENARAVDKAASPLSSSGSNADTPKAVFSTLQARNSGNRRSSTIRQPKLGVFIMDPTRAVLTIDGAGKNQKNHLWPARVQSARDAEFWQRMQSLSGSRGGSLVTSPRNSVQLTPTDDESNGFGRSLSIDSASGFFDASGSLLTDQVIGPAEAFLPFTSVSSGGDITFDESLQAIGGAEEEEDDPLSFLNFGDDDEDEDMPDESDVLMSPSTSNPFPYLNNNNNTNNNNSAPKNGGFDLLAHLDARRGVVGSFRRNQQFARHVGSLPSHPALRASTSESNAMQTGRRAAANTPITPLRKNKMGKSVGARSSPISSPLTKSPPLKRKGPVRGGFGGRQ